MFINVFVIKCYDANEAILEQAKVTEYLYMCYFRMKKLKLYTKLVQKTIP